MRRRPAEPRGVPPDPKFNSVLVAGFINKILTQGKKSVAQRIVYGSFERIEKEAKRPALEVFQQAIHNVAPVLQVKPRRVGGATYQVPVEITQNRREPIAMRWIIAAAQARKGKPMVERLAAELLDAARGQGTAVKRREDLHKMAEANRAFVHYRW